MKYRLLSDEELTHFKKDFIDYLVVNGLTGEDWAKMKEERVEDANKILDSFSDVVFESIFRKNMFLDHVSKNKIKCFQCLGDKIVLIGLNSSNSSIDFTTLKDFSVLANTKGLEVYTSEKEYTKQREIEMFEMTNDGCSLSKGEMFKKLSLLL